MRIGIDVDGVLADFNHAFGRLLIKETGRNLLRKVDLDRPLTWYWDKDAGYTNEEISNCWNKIKASNHFWYDLDPLLHAEEFLTDLSTHYDNNKIDEIYFITTRFGIGVQRQTYGWLWGNTMETPSVLIAKNSAQKGELAAALNLTHFIDDKPENVEAVAAKSPTTQTYLLDYPYNAQCAVGRRIFSLEAFLGEIN